MPRIPTQNTRLLQVRITPKEYDALERLAFHHNITIAELLRRQIRHTIIATAPLLDGVQERVA